MAVKSHRHGIMHNNPHAHAITMVMSNPSARHLNLPDIVIQRYAYDDSLSTTCTDDDGDRPNLQYVAVSFPLMETQHPDGGLEWSVASLDDIPIPRCMHLCQHPHHAYRRRPSEPRGVIITAWFPSRRRRNSTSSRRRTSSRIPAVFLHNAHCSGLRQHRRRLVR